MTRLAIEGLTCRHGLLTAVEDLSVTLGAGEVLCIIGANGAGKTTLMRAIAGVHRPAAGRIRLNGVDVTALSAFRRVRAGIAMSPEGQRLFSDMSLRENLVIAAENGRAKDGRAKHGRAKHGRAKHGRAKHGRAGDWTLARVLEAFPQLAPLIDKPAGGLPGGQRQAAAIGRALLSNPDVLLLDEVSLGLSPAATQGVYQSLAAIKAARRMAIVVVEQDLGRALGFADRILCMAEGRVELRGAPGDFTRDQITAANFGIHTGEQLDA